MFPFPDTEQQLTTSQKWDRIFGKSAVEGTDHQALLKSVINFANSESDLTPAVKERIEFFYSHQGLVTSRRRLRGVSLPFARNQSADEWARQQLICEKNIAQAVLRLNVRTGSSKKKRSDPYERLVRARFKDRSLSTQVAFKPVFVQRTKKALGKSTFSFQLYGPLDPTDWLDYLFAVMRSSTEDQQIKRLQSDLCQCHARNCKRFFLKVKPRIGRFRTKYCCTQCMNNEHDAKSTVRSRNRRAGIRQEDRAMNRRSL